MPIPNLPYSSLVSTADQCRNADRVTIESFGVVGFTLMETAGLQATTHIASMEAFRGREGLYFCGTGNNGGDALVVARYMAIHHGHSCHICFPTGQSDLTPDTETNLQLLKTLESEGYSIIFSEDPDHALNAGADYIVDGLLGTGLSSKLRPPLDRVIEKMNNHGGRIYAMDIPSGLNADTGQPMPVAVRATVTFSFGSLKTGFYLEQSADYCGSIVQCNLTFPESARKGVARLVTSETAEWVPEVRRSARHKYSDRVVYIVAGSPGLTGAAMLSARAAWKSGAGAVFLVTPAGSLSVYEQALPEIVKLPVGGNQERVFTEEHEPQVRDLLSERDGVLLIGPGLGRRDSTRSFVRALLRNSDLPCIADADALQAGITLPRECDACTILTPHTGELKALADLQPGNDFERLIRTGEWSESHRLWLVSKGQPTVVGTPDGHRYLTGYDTSLFSRAGFGDLLSGTIAGLLAITEDAETSILRALVDGKRRADRHLEKTGRLPEPAELL